MPVTADQLGKLYDILIATRDGSTLPCTTLQGVAVNVGQVAYMLSTTKPSTRTTEIQRKDMLTQLSSAQVIDREFDAWPQVEQGDWSDGQGQRVFSGQGEALGTVSNKSTEYWDGLGILWPINDYLPQRPILGTADQGESGAIMQALQVGCVAGNWGGGSVIGFSSYAYSYMQNAAPQHNILAIQNNGTLRKIDPIPGTTNGSAQTNQFLAYKFGLGSLWVATLSVTTMTLAQYFDGAPPAVGASTTFNAQPGNPLAIDTAQVGNKQYVAVLHTAFAGILPSIQLYDFTNGVFTAAVLVNVTGDNGAGGGLVTQMAFNGDNIVCGVIEGPTLLGGRGWITQYNIPSQTWSTLATFTNVNNILFCPIAGGLFVLAALDTAQSGAGNLVDMYILQGNNLQHIGPVQIQSSGVNASNAIAGELEPQAYGPYAVFGVYYRPASQATTSIQVFAYDVLRGRLFKVQDFGGYNIFLRPDNGGRQMFVTSSNTHGTSIGTLATELMIGVPVLSRTASAQDVNNVQTMLAGIASSGFGNPFIQQGVQITSSLIDFTSAQNKLYRQLVASFTPLPNDAGITVQLDAWFDQDPTNLAAVPDFTTGAVAAGVNGGVTGQTQLKLVCNKIARKVVYRITTVGPTASNGAVKLISVAIQVATGWSLHYFLDISRAVLCNDGQQRCFQNQAPVDDFVAHQFLEQLWRRKGGECQVTLPGPPGGETFPALLQLVSAESLKHITPSAISDHGPVSHNVIVELKIREDV